MTSVFLPTLLKLESFVGIPIENMPAVNSGLNGLATLCLLIGYIFIRNKKYVAHGVSMIAALVASAAFLACYVAYHYSVGHKSSELQPGVIKTTYLIFLFSHIVLAVVMLPMIIATFYYAARRKWDSHRWIAKLTWPIWIYVSITGVAIYFFLYHIEPLIR